MRQTELHATVERLASEGIGPSSYRVSVQEGHPLLLVLERLDKGIPDLIVLGSHGYDGLARSMMGSVAENVVRVAACPMLVVKGDPLPSKASLGRVVCPVNLTDAARDGAKLAVLCASMFGARLELVQSVEESSADLEKSQSQLREWASRHGVGGATARVLRGEASEQVVSYLRQSPADLVVIGAEQRPFLEFTTLGRTTERVMRHSSCSVLLLPRRL
jgi:nucleotide-binding universal stress UspA family protein